MLTRPDRCFLWKGSRALAKLAPPLLAPAGTPRLGPRLTGTLPELNAAAAAWAQRAALQPAAPGDAAAALAADDLPLAELRRGGRLFAESQDAVPTVVRPSQELRLPLRLGWVELPLATLNEQELRTVQVGAAGRGMVRERQCSCPAALL